MHGRHKAISVYGGFFQSPFRGEYRSEKDISRPIREKGNPSKSPNKKPKVTTGSQSNLRHIRILRFRTIIFKLDGGRRLASTTRERLRLDAQRAANSRPDPIPLVAH
ncbi:hypothetical protein GWI33_007897 [Rhynchophorus ferrugineus]|uniref:Uncharacterized protein n=1 Tax=Rhynchophorus ferrugineus TaxID=354439 RepID=A0A834MBK9_RHYFE|nr:hypothetical protein GWI33_007897 [Rhynchophorus ferrugineus]